MYIIYIYINTWQFCVTFFGWWKRDPNSRVVGDLQRSGMKFGHGEKITWYHISNMFGGIVDGLINHSLEVNHHIKWWFLLDHDKPLL